MISWTILFSHVSNVKMLLKIEASTNKVDTNIFMREIAIIIWKGKVGRGSKQLVKEDVSYVLEVLQQVVAAESESVVQFNSVEEAIQELRVLFMQRNI